MTRFLFCVAVFSSFSAANSTRFLRREEFGDPREIGQPGYQKYCGSVNCPRGYVEIDNADYVKCDYCSQDNCCDRLCSSYLCPNGYVEDPDEFTSKCEDSKCTVSQCCIYRPRWCSSFLCPHSLVLVDHASRKKCLDGKCTAERCCVDKPGINV